jgi:hypothetical protein
VGGLALALAWLTGRWLLPARMQRWQRTGSGLLLFAGFYGLLHVVVVPPLAALGGRVPLPCAAEPDRPFAAAHPLFCRLDRHYVDPPLVTLMTNLSREVAREYPGTITLYLDGNFPFLNGFPLLPHLSHSDGRKLDIAYYYRGGELRSPIGYWAFEEPAPGETPSPCRAGAWLTTRWDMRFLQGVFPDRPLEPERTRTALRWLTVEGQQYGIERIFIEPYLAKRLGVSSPLLGFQGCRAARHDDHIHIQIRR